MCPPFRTPVEPVAPAPAPRRLTPLHGVAVAALLLFVSASPRCVQPDPQPAVQPRTLTCPPYCEAVADLVEGHRIRVTCDC